MNNRNELQVPSNIVLLSSDLPAGGRFAAPVQFYAASQLADKKVGSEIFPGSAGGKSSYRVTNFIIATDWLTGWLAGTKLSPSERENKIILPCLADSHRPCQEGEKEVWRRRSFCLPATTVDCNFLAGDCWNEVVETENITCYCNLK